MIVNNTFVSLRRLARHEGLADDSTDMSRLHKMYEHYFFEEGGTNFADTLIAEVFQYSESHVTDAVPLLIQSIVLPQYAIRAFFKAYDNCNDDRVTAEAFWDLGVAVLVGSLEGDTATGISGDNGLSWYGLGKLNCPLFQCGDGESLNPVYNRRMMENINFGRDKIRSGHCNEALRNKISAMESLLVTPLLQGALFNTYARATANTQASRDKAFAQAYVYGKAILPFLNVANKADANVINESLFNNAPFGDNDAKKIWTAIILSFEDLGVDCKHLGTDVNAYFMGSVVHFCDIVNDMTKFPTPAPNLVQQIISPSPI